jgi:hypothetical protein
LKFATARGYCSFFFSPGVPRWGQRANHSFFSVDPL